jgi:hypothetical protein
MFSAERRRHELRVAAFFQALDVNVLCPSDAAKDFWTKKSDLRAASIRTVPHMTLSWLPRETLASPRMGRMTVAFLGMASAYKGWPVFERLTRSHADVARFVFFGIDRPPAGLFDHVPVHVTAADPDAMIAAVARENVDLVLHWPSCFETFSISTHEALAAGAYIVTHPASGNVAATVRTLERGTVLQDAADLSAFFRDGRAEGMVHGLRDVRRRYEVKRLLSPLSFSAVI